MNLWWETLRDPNFERAIALLAMRGRMIVMAGRDARPPFPVGPFYTKDCAIHGFAMFNASAAEQHAAALDINAWAAEGKLRAPIDACCHLQKQRRRIGFRKKARSKRPRVSGEKSSSIPDHSLKSSRNGKPRRYLARKSPDQGLRECMSARRRHPR